MLPGLDFLVGVFDHYQRRVDHRADRDRDAAQRHDVGVDALVAHHRKSHQHAQRQRDDRHQRRAQMPQEGRADQGDDDELLDQLVRQIADRAFDQRAAVIGIDDFNPRRQAFLQLGQFGLDRGDGGLRVLARAQDDDAASDFALAVEFGDAAAHFGADLDRRHIAELYRNARAHDQRDRPEVVERFQIAAGAHHVFDLSQLKHRAAGLLVAGFQRLAHLAVADAIGCQLARIKQHLVLPHHAADRSDFGHIGQAFQLVFEEPILQRAQFGQ